MRTAEADGKNAADHHAAAGNYDSGRQRKAVACDTAKMLQEQGKWIIYITQYNI